MKLHTLKKLSSELALSSLFSGRDGTIIRFEDLAIRGRFPYCTGGYRRSMLDRDNHEFPIPVWYESKSDPHAVFREDRSYIRLYCVNERAFSLPQQREYLTALKTWKALLLRDGRAETATDTEARITALAKEIGIKQAERSAQPLLIHVR